MRSPGGYTTRTPWTSRFPDVVIQAVEGSVKGHDDYLLAKSGSKDAAYRLVAQCLNDGSFSRIELFINGGVSHMLGVHAYEETGHNAIPTAYAQVLANTFGVIADTNVVQVNVVGHTGARGFQRIARQAEFSGRVEQGGRYLLVDDFVGMGGTLANVRGHVERLGGLVVGATVLTGKPHSAILALTQQTLEKLRQRHGKALESWWKKRFGGGFDLLTESEARYLYGHKKVEQIRDRITEAEEP